MSILVALDTSELSQTALPKATELAAALSESLLMVTVADRETLAAIQPLAHNEGEEVIDMVELWLRNTARSVDGVQVRTDVVKGKDPAAALVDRAARPDVSMLVLATHGRTGMSRWRLGTVAERVVRGATVPVVVVPAPWRGKLADPPAS